MESISTQKKLDLISAKTDKAWFRYNNVFLQCSDSFTEHFGRNDSQLLGQSIESISPISQTNGQKSIGLFNERIRAANAGLSQSFEWEFIRADFSTFYGIVSLETIDEEDGSLLGAFTLIKDYHFSKTNFRESNAHLQQLLDNTTAVVYVKDYSGRFLFVNETFSNVCQLPQTDIVGKSVTELFPKPIADAFIENDKKVFEAKRALEFEEIGEFNGETKTFISIKFPLFNRAGDVYAVCGISTDITARKKDEDALRNVALGVSGATGNDIFQAISHYLATTLNVEFAFIGRLTECQKNIRTLAIYFKGKIINNLEYELKNTPCDKVVGGDFFMVPDKLLEHFGDDDLIRDNHFQSYAGFPLFDSNGTALGLITICSQSPLQNRNTIKSVMEIFSVRASAELERMKADLVIKENMEQYQAIFNASTDALLLLSEDGALVDINPAWRKLHGFNADFPIEKIKVSDFIPPESIKYFHEFINNVRDDQPFHVKTNGMKVTGERFFVDVTGVRMHYQGKPHLLGILRDISEARYHEEKLLKSEDRLRATVEASLDCIISMDQTGHIIEFNPAAERCFGYSREETMGKLLAELIIPARYRNSHQNGLQRFLNTDNGPVLGQRIEVHAMRSNKEEFLAELAIDVAEGVDGKIFIGYLRDITDKQLAEKERSRLEEQLRQAQKMEAIGHLTGGIAHDFNNILTSINGYVVLAAEKIEKYQDDKITKYLSRAQRSGERAKDLIQQMLTFSRGQRGEPKALSLEPLIKETVKMLESSLPSTIELKSNITQNTSNVMIDPVHFEQVLMNLCINARDALTHGGIVSIGLAMSECKSCTCGSCLQNVDGQFIEVSVKDNGAGIPADVQERMFEPFYSTKEVGKGSGMGLSTVHGIIHEYGGHILVDSKPNLGTEFRVLLKPLNTECNKKQMDSISDEGTLENNSLLSGCVVVVEDELEVSEFVEDMLDNWGLDVNVFNHSPDALKFILDNHNKIDLILTDYTMPKLTGIDLAASLKREKISIPTILYTGYSNNLSDNDLTNSGISALVKKPIDVANMFEIVKSLL